MKNLVMLVCDHVSTDSGFPTLYDVLHNIGAPRVPVMRPLTVYVELAIEPDEEGQPFHLRLDLLDGDGRNLVSNLGEGDYIAPTRVHPQMQPVWAPQYTLPGLTFPATGEYLFRLTVGDQVVAERTFTVIPV